MKVIAINASKRKGNTYALLSQIQTQLNSNSIQVEILNLYDYQIDSCIGCEVCVLKGQCVLKDDTALLMEKLKSADGIILSSPVYLQSICGKLKTFVDKTCAWFHRPALYGKPMLVVATTKGSGLADTLRYLEKVGTQWGVYHCGAIGRDIRTSNKAIQSKELARFVKALHTDRKQYRPTYTSVVNFSVQKVLANQLIGLDQVYWEEKGWDKMPYYFECKMSPFKKLAGGVTYHFLNRVMASAKNRAEAQGETPQ
ncbi:MAG: flavodoxin family protein [Erysipelotrichaceae bacterium]